MRRAGVLVLGGGMSGLCAAVSALEAGADVLVAEKGARLGGSMWLSNGLIWTFKDKSAVRTEVSGNEALQDLVVDNASDDQQWLERLGVELAPERSFQWYGRGRIADPQQMTNALAARVAALGGQIVCGLALSTLEEDSEGRYRAELVGQNGTVRIDAGCVVLATGGFQGNPELLARYVTRNAEFMYLRSNPWSTGDGLSCALALGAASTSGLGHMYGHALVAPPARFDASQFSEATQRYGNHALALNLSGKRFADESAGTAEETLNAAVAHEEKATAIYIVDDNIANLSNDQVSMPPRVAIARAAAFGGPVIYADSLPALADLMQTWGVPATKSLASISEFNDALINGRAEQLTPPRARNRHPVTKPPFAAVQVRAAITFTCGGIATDADMRVLRRAETISTLPMVLAEPADITYLTIPRLFAAGCDVGGVSGRGYMGGLATALVTGRRAGSQAALDAACRGGIAPGDAS